LHNEECDEPFISDLQFRCADNACTHIEGRCNGINNCADGSDEESCSSLDLKRDLIIEATTGFSASVETLTAHSEVFYDRNYVFNSLGSFSGHSYIKMSNEDKHTPHSHVQMKLRSPAPLTVYIVRNSAHALPWLHSDGWSISDLQGVSYQGTRSTPHKEWATDNVANYEFSTDHFPEAPWISEVWQKTFPAGIVELRGDGGDGSYLIFVANVVTPPTPPTLDLWDQHLEDHHKCNNNIDVQYVSSQQACQQLAVANGHEFYSFRHNAQSSGHKCMSSATCDSPLDGRTNPWNIYSSNSGAAQYVGCFKDDGARDLGAMVGSTGAVTNTFQGCRAACGDHQYMSLQYGGECFCANSYGNGPQYTQEDDGNCNSIREPCSSSSFNCGGTWHQAIYQINPVTTPPTAAPEPELLESAPFIYGQVASNTCPTKDVSETDCLAAAQSLQGVVPGRRTLVSGSWGWVAPGCSVQSHRTHGRAGDWAAHYNRNSGGNNDGGYTPVCMHECQHLHNQDVTAGTFEHYGLDYSNSPSDDHCSATCTANRECTAWVRQPSTGRCWISRQSVVTFEADSDRTTGLRCDA